ncbi:hypothetical protein [Tabrizicola fusiformis]|uniref:hypothetical protein n=1 Tax=Tabrizicola sp. SY72 TaxID=2741673 RepID=UPI001572FA5D|nr:hypothetical protein [Tabrizicola sp. SY72]NTT88241.1 hypothetical protein [Tabrizicola sp. SY72]
MLDRAKAIELAGQVERLLIGATDWSMDRTGYDRSIAAITAAFETAGGAAWGDTLGWVVRAHGFRATSTSGPVSACRNWISQVGQKGALLLPRHPATNIGE